MKHPKFNKAKEVSDIVPDSDRTVQCRYTAALPGTRNLYRQILIAREIFPKIGESYLDKRKRGNYYDLQNNCY